MCGVVVIMGESERLIFEVVGDISGDYYFVPLELENVWGLRRFSSFFFF